MSNNKIKCELCEKQFSVITGKHLISQHGITLEDYKIMFPTSPLYSPAALERKKLSAKKANSNRKGVARSETIKNKIKNTKLKNPTPAWNKGVAMSDEQKNNLSAIKKQKFATGEIIHWNTGKSTPRETKEKISNTLLDRHSATREARLAEEIGIKNELATTIIELTSQMRCTIANELPPTENTIKRLKSILQHEIICRDHNIWLKNVNITEGPLMEYELMCDVCLSHFSITNQYFRPSKLKSRDCGFCPTCHPRSYSSSRGEIELYEFIQSIVDCEVIANTRLELQGKELDVYVPSMNIAFEYNGNYWHSEQIHKDKHNINTKRLEADKNNIRLITIFEDEWINKREICENRITHILNKSTKRIHARKCNIVQLDNCNSFLDTYHIQGADRSSLKLGAMYNGELVAVMTFKNTNMVKGGDGTQMELSRFATSGISSPGLANKLFSHYLKHHHIKGTDIISYSDNRWNTGNLYANLGFAYISCTPPNYWYMPPSCSERIHRGSFMKHKLVKQGYDSTLTEKQIMDDRGYYRIWDCGSTKWEYSI